MTFMSHDPVTAVIGAQLVEMSTAAVAAGAGAAPSITALPPAGAEEVSMMAATAFGLAGQEMLATHTAAQQELARAGTALVDVTRMYAQTDSSAAGTLMTNAAETGAIEFTGSPGAPMTSVFSPSAGAGLLRSETLPGAAGTAARTPLMTNLVEGTAASTHAASSTTTPGAAGKAASAFMGAASAPLSSVTQLASSMGGSMGGPMSGSAGGAAGASGPGVAASLASDKKPIDEDAAAKRPAERTGDGLV